MENRRTTREGFSSGLAVFFATLGSAVGLGNIWKLPYIIGESGGGAFLLIYVLCIFLVGIPVMISEFYIGRKTRKNSVGAFKELNANPAWKSVGFAGILSAYFIMFFYSDVAGWVYSYVFRVIRGDFANITTETAGQKFNSTLLGPVSPIIWQIVVMAVVSVILIAGVKKGIEKVTKTLMPVLFILIIICGIRAVTLPGSFEGIRFLFNVDFTKVTSSVLLTALGLAFFKLSLGMGTMITYGSYFTEDNNMINTSIRVALSDTLVSLLAGIAIFPAVFSFHMKPSAGPGLLFMTIPLLFSKMAFGNILLIAFFLLSSIAATTAMLSLVEVPVAYFTEERGMSRKKAVILNSLIIVLFGVLATLSADNGSVLSRVKIFGKTFFDLFDFLSSNVLLPAGGLLIAIFAGHLVNKKDLTEELSNKGTLHNNRFIEAYYFILRYITPVLLAIVFISSLGVLNYLFKWIRG